MKEFLIKTFGVTFGSTVVSFAARIMIALLMLYTGSATSFGDALGIALNRERAIASAATLINETPKKEITKALVEEQKEVVK